MILGNILNLASKIKEKCLKCKKPVSSRQNRINCNLCKEVFHLKCTELTKSKFQSYQKGKLLFNCIYCTNYSCLKCDKHVYDNVGKACCNKCDKWIHKSCANIREKNIKPWRKTNQVKKSGFVMDASTFPSQTLIIKICSFYMKMKTTLLLTQTLLNLVLPAVFVYIS